MNRSDEGLTLETSAFESLWGDQFTLSTQVIKSNYFLNNSDLLVYFETAEIAGLRFAIA